MTIALGTPALDPQPDRVQCGPADRRLRERARSARSPPATRRGSEPVADCDRCPRTRTAALRTGPQRASRSADVRTGGPGPRGAGHHVRTAVGPRDQHHSEHQRGGPHAAAPAGIEGVHTALGRSPRHDDHRDHHAADRPARRRGSLRGRRGHRPALPGAGDRRTARRSSRGREALLRVGRRLLQALQLERGRTRAGDPDGVERARRLHRRHGRRTPPIRSPTT